MANVFTIGKHILFKNLPHSLVALIGIFCLAQVYIEGKVLHLAMAGPQFFNIDLPYILIEITRLRMVQELHHGIAV